MPSILITGCSSGIGYATAHHLRDHGWTVFASCRAEADCARLTEEGFTSPLIDYAQADTITQGLAQCLTATNGTLDAVFNNGAYAIPGLVQDVPTDALRAIFETNFFGVAELTRQALAHMLPLGRGRILQCSSVLGFAAMPWRSAYNVTKFAMEGHADTLRLELRGSGVDVVLIQPGPIRTRIRENAQPHFERWIDWEASLRADDYARFRDRLYGEPRPDPGELTPLHVARVVRKALTARRPRPRYRITTPTKIAAVAKRLLPTRTMDWLLNR